MKAVVKPLDPAAEFETPERCFITEVANDPRDPDLSVARARVVPGTTTARHKLHGVAERYIIVSGQGLVEVDGLHPAPVSAGDVVCIPPDTPQRITCTGNEDLIFFAVCTPRFTPGCYISLEQT